MLTEPRSNRIEVASVRIGLKGVVMNETIIVLLIVLLLVVLAKG